MCAEDWVVTKKDVCGEEEGPLGFGEAALLLEETALFGEGALRGEGPRSGEGDLDVTWRWISEPWECREEDRELSEADTRAFLSDLGEEAGDLPPDNLCGEGERLLGRGMSGELTETLRGERFRGELFGVRFCVKT
mmetsp:Transcript_22483/g.34919  ORF Transcript_22483/g.34919 Transcript_22483/m.34919 type:complete len:136 (-) Transcript_22483:1721-2128(-)